MPYKTNEDLPDSIQGALPGEAQTTWRKIYNSAAGQYEDEATRAATAWAGLKKAGWEKRDGKWVKIEKNFEIFVPISKLDDEQQIVFGWGSVVKINGVPVVDLQGDVIEEAELEKAVYEFMAAPKHDEMHKRQVSDSIITESFMVTDEKLSKMFPKDTMPQGFRGWWLGIKMADAELYRKHKEGIYTGFSIAGSAIRKEVKDDAEFVEKLTD